jgi:hypothetical protein
MGLLQKAGWVHSMVLLKVLTVTAEYEASVPQTSRCTARGGSTGRVGVSRGVP